MATLTVTPITRSGIALPSTAAGASGDVFTNTGKEALIVNNGGGVDTTVTITTPCTVDGLAVGDRTVTVGASATKIIGPFPTGYYNNTDGQVAVACSPYASVNVGVIQLTPV